MITFEQKSGSGISAVYRAYERIITGVPINLPLGHNFRPIGIAAMEGCANV